MAPIPCPNTLALIPGTYNPTPRPPALCRPLLLPLCSSLLQGSEAALRGPSCTAPPPHSCRVLKLLSEDPGNYADAPREGIRRILEQVYGMMGGAAGVDEGEGSRAGIWEGWGTRHGCIRKGRGRIGGHASSKQMVHISAYQR